MSRRSITAPTLITFALSTAISGWAFAQPAAAATAGSSAAETEEVQLNESTVIYEAAYFNEFAPVNVNDMIDRIPGISLALGGGGGNRRGLGSGGNEILINGQRQTGKSNAGRSQLSRISADQVDYIEIIRGTSEDIEVRGGGQIVNVVLLDSASRSSITAQVNGDYLQDDTFAPGGNLAITGQQGALSYLFAVSADPRYRNTTAFESSFDADGKLLETRSEERTRDQTDYETSFNLGYSWGKHVAAINGLYGFAAPPEDRIRSITDQTGDLASTRFERERFERNRENWEIGGDYEYGFDNGGTYRLLFIVNDREGESTRERFDIGLTADEKNLYLYNYGRDRERIVRTSYTWNVAGNQGLELGVERAQTIRDNDLRLGVDGSGESSAAVGGLVPVSVENAQSTVSELRYENFANHNWQLNEQMSLESALVYEISTITQTGDVSRERDFAFLRPRFDFRYDLTQSMQFRATVEKTVSQLSFSDFSVSADSSDEDQNVQGGNPDIRQEQAWEYSANLEYRLPENMGVLNTELFYRDISDVIDRVDASPSEDDLLSARGNIGDGVRYGARLNASLRLGFMGLPNAIFTNSLTVQESEVTDPFLGVERRMRWNGRWFNRTQFRHDVTRWNFSYGFNYDNADRDSSARATIDVFDIERDFRPWGLNLFVEKRAFGGMTFRVDVRDVNNPLDCRQRIRFDGRVTSGIVEEVESFCSQEGPRWAFEIRNTF